MSYKNFDLAIYCTAWDINKINDLDEFSRKFQFLEKNLCVGKVYLETFRGGDKVSPEKMLTVKKFFEGKGIKTSGGITTAPSDDPNNEKAGFHTFCYTNEKHKEELKKIIEITAGIFDEVILDDFYFTNCKCDSCIREKGDRSWAEFRTDLKKHISQELIMKTAKAVNPKVNMIIKYPNWYEHYQETGYNLKDESEIYDMIYTGTETRNPLHTPQHLQRYLSYFNMRYLENVKPGKNGGGWFDPFECTYNLNSYVEQAYLTLFSKPRETMLFCLGALLEGSAYSICVPMVGYAFSTLDKYIGELGNPAGISCYIPYHSSGEDFLHNYIGMLGIPQEPSPEYPFDSKSIFLTANAAKDEEIIEKMKKSLIKGGKVIITSGLLKELQDKGFSSIANVRCTDRKAAVNKFLISVNNGVTFNHSGVSDKAIIIPQIDFCTNDTWTVVAGLGTNNNFPILLQTNYGKGSLYVLSIPDDFGDLYYYPKEALKPIRNVMAAEAEPALDTVSQIGLFTYDNDTFIVESFVPEFEDVEISVNKPDARLRDIANGKTITGTTRDEKTLFSINLTPGTYKMYKII